METGYFDLGEFRCSAAAPTGTLDGHIKLGGS